MAGTSVNIQLKTTADTSGADKLNASLGITATRERELAAIRAQFMSAAEAEVATVNKLKDASLKAAEAQARQAESASKLTEAYHRLSERTKAANTQAAVNPWATASRGHQVNIENVNRLSEAQVRVAGSSRNMGNALLQGSRALQDMQYGLAGAVNNLEGIASALGLGAGVAGVVTVLAVAVQSLGPKVVDWFKSLNQEGANIDKLKQQLGDVSTALREGYSASQQAATEASAAFTEQVKEESRAVDEEKKAIDAVIASLRLRNQIQDTADEFALRNQVEGIRASDLSPQEKQQQEASARLQFEQAKKSRADQLANDEAAAAQMKINADRELSALREKQAQQAEQDLAQSERVAKILDPKNAGSLTALQDRRRTLMATDPTAVGKTPEELQARIDELDATIASRIAEIEAFASKVAGGSISLNDPASVEGFQKTISDRASSLRGEGQALDAQASREQAVFDAAGGDRAMQQQLRDLQLAQKQRELLSTAGALPADAPLFKPADPLTGLAPLPRLAPGLTSGAQPANPLTGIAPLPGAGSFSQMPPNPLGGTAAQPLPDLPQAAKAAAESNAQANAAMLDAFKKMQADNKKLTEQLKNSRS